jgi:hypothetical protein
MTLALAFELHESYIVTECGHGHGHGACCSEYCWSKCVAQIVESSAYCMYIRKITCLAAAVSVITLHK